MVCELVEVCVGPVEAIPPGEGRNYEVGEERVAVFRQRDGRLFATQARCPHREAPLADGLIGGGELVCPYHAYRFNLTTGACANDAACLLRTYAVREEDQMIFLTV